MRHFLADAALDIRYATRKLLSHPASSALTVAILAVGIGANVTLAGAVRFLLLTPPPHVADPGDVVRIVTVGAANGAQAAVAAATYPNVLDLQREATAFASVAGFTTRQLSLGRGPDAIDARVEIVSSEYFPLLGARPLIGRTFGLADFPASAAAGGPALAVLSHSFWSRAFGRDSTVPGRAIALGELSYQVAGVMPEGFRGLGERAPDIWVPLNVAARDQSVNISLSDRSRYSMAVIGRVRPGRHLEAERQATSIWDRDALPGLGGEPARTRVVLAPVLRSRGPDAPREVRVTLWLAGISLLVLLITCGNVANLLLGQALARRREVTVRLALGASRGRMARQFLVEGLVLAAAGAAAALLLAAVAGPPIRAALAGDGAPSGRFIDAGLFAFTAAIALGTGVLVSLAPIVHSLAGDPFDGFRAGQSSPDRRQSAARLGLLTLQSGICMAMLVIATLFGLSLKRAAGLDLGVDAEHTVRAIVNLDRLLLSNEALDGIYDEIARRVRAVPGVAGVAFAGTDPYQSGRAVAPYTIERGPDEIWPPTTRQVPMEAAVGEGFFRAVGARGLRGRDFNRGDDRGGPRVAIINEPLARAVFGKRDPVGQCIMLPTGAEPGQCTTVVGVLSGVWYFSMTDRERPMAYIPLRQRRAYAGYFRPQGVFVRVHGDPAPVTAAIRAAIQGVRSDLPAVRISLLRDAVAIETRPWRLGTVLFGLFAAVAVVIAVLGLYALVDFAASQRVFELAVRLALGASRIDVVRTIAGSAFAAVAAGLVLGALVVLAVGTRLTAMLFQTAADSPPVILGAAVSVLAVCAIAVLRPALRVLRLPVGAILRGQ